ncbi:hypothetical protein KW797_01085 [Candidatus Parcubacteria bacterium]|nr:hypothetical protein [Candidatus Parcubacteria bacterium]
MDDPKPSNPIWWFLGIMAMLWFVWFLTGGPERAKNAEIFIQPSSSPITPTASTSSNPR